MADDNGKRKAEEAKDKKATPEQQEKKGEKKQKPTVTPEWTLYSR